MAENTTPIRVHIENAADDQIGGFTIPLPTTREALAPWVAALEAGQSGQYQHCGNPELHNGIGPRAAADGLFSG